MLAPEAISQAAADEQQSGEDHGVGIDDPLQLAGSGVQVPHQGGQCHIEDGVVQVDDEGGSTEHHQGAPAVRMALARWHINREKGDAHDSFKSTGQSPPTGGMRRRSAAAVRVIHDREGQPNPHVVPSMRTPGGAGASQEWLAAYAIAYAEPSR